MPASASSCELKITQDYSNRFTSVAPLLITAPSFARFPFNIRNPLLHYEGFQENELLPYL